MAEDAFPNPFRHDTVPFFNRICSARHATSGGRRGGQLRLTSYPSSSTRTLPPSPTPHLGLGFPMVILLLMIIGALASLHARAVLRSTSSTSRLDTDDTPMPIRLLLPAPRLLPAVTSRSIFPTLNIQSQPRPSSSTLSIEHGADTDLPPAPAPAPSSHPSASHLSPRS
ncbi:hypothetical protein B0H13DRAFT_2384052 [Mycena leptocephala]|nr:hypothetical protein B0H13DRAFT_2384052 [Mycena leptocephala]